MVNFNLNKLGAEEFEDLVQSLLKEVIGSGTLTFGAGRDGGREATFEGPAPYPSVNSGWDGNWIFQAKFHDVDLLGVTKARRAVLQDLTKELDKIVLKYKYPCDNYILITNVPLTGVAETGNLDLALKRVIPQHKGYIKNVHIWSADDVNKLLNKYSSIRTRYLEFLVTGDLIYKLIAQQEAQLDEIESTIRSYITVTFSREQNAQLDQAGDVTEEALKLQKLFFDLSARFEPGGWQDHQDGVQHREYYAGPEGTVQNIEKFLLSEAEKRTVLVGGPGEGKSTIGQYLAQLHRAMLLNRIDEIAISPDYYPTTPRIPIRVQLKDFGQWLAEQRDRDGIIHGTLEDYICRDIRRSTSRDVATTGLHQVIKTNPALLILDGLDEVTDLELRKTLLTRINEFTGRCDNVIKGDLQVVASTRPTGYVEHFDTHTYRHFQLTKLTEDQVKKYVSRWTVARNLDPNRKDRVGTTVDECLADRQINLLMSTPLQVTILLLIISTGGKPQYQREALFTDYLEVIYKRETSKGRNIIETDKQLLIGLHKYIGYILHENTTRAESTGALLSSHTYARYVEQFLRWNDPIVRSDKLRKDLRAITKEAGERLVLIIEPTEGHHGFELRSIQEYFAARHLADTSLNTEQRYARFDAIARLPYWRNVALFFAGRVGSGYPGEASNIIEVCLAMNREGPGSFARVGSMLAFELAADRAFGPNRRLQHRLLEVAVAVFDDYVAGMQLPVILDYIQRLTTDDQKEIVLPLLKEQLERLSPEYVLPIVNAIRSISEFDSSIESTISKLSLNRSFRVEAAKILLTSEPSSTRRNLFKNIALSFDSRDVDELLTGLRGERLFSCTKDLISVPLSSELCVHAVKAILKSGGFAFGSREDFEFLRSEVLKPWPVDPIEQVMRCLLIHGLISRSDAVGLRRMDQDRELAEFTVPDSILTESVIQTVSSEPFMHSPALQLPVWIVHLIMGSVTQESASTFVGLFRVCRRYDYVEKIFTAPPAEMFPYFDLLINLSRFKVRPPWSRLIRMLTEFAGSDGRARWNSIRTHSLYDRSPAARHRSHQATTFGLFGINDGKAVELAVNRVGRFYSGILAEYVFFRRTGPYSEADYTEPVKKLIAAIGRDRMLTAPRIMMVRRACIRRSSHFRALGPHFVELLKVLVELNCGALFPELTAVVLVACLQGEPLMAEEFTRNVLEEIKMDKSRRPIFIPASLAGSPSLYKTLVEISSESHQTPVRKCARLLIMSLAESRFITSRPSIDLPVIRFRGFAELHRALADGDGDEAHLTALALFAIRRPSASADWRLLSQLIRACRSSLDVRVLRSVAIENWDNAEIINESTSLLIDCIPIIKSAEVASLLTEWLQVLISKSSQSLAPVESSLGLPLQQETS